MTGPSILTHIGSMTEQEALDNDLDMIPKLHTQREADHFRQKLQSYKSQICELISRHLQIPESDFVLDEPSAWIEGGFNICLGFDINCDYRPNLPQRALIRFPLPFNVGEDFAPGTMDEKLRCEAATYIWMRENCPNIPLPRLLGMGFPGLQSFTAIENETFFNRLCWYLRRTWNWLHGDKISPYSRHTRTKLPDLGYLVLEWVSNGVTLLDSWIGKISDKERTTNLYHGIARTMLDLAKVPLPKIGSWTMDDNGVLTLTNRPFFDLTLLWNQHKIPTGILRDTTYTSTEPFIHDTIRYQDHRMFHQLNSILGVNDGVHQLTALVGMRALLPHFFNAESREGPFVLSMPDLHARNIFVDDDWNIVSIVDLEFCPVVPIQMIQVPQWLTLKGVDQLHGPDLEIYKQHYDEFVNILEQEEKTLARDNSYSQRLRQEWDTGRVWYIMALGTINAFPSIFEQHLQPRFFEEGFETHVQGKPISRLWCEDVDSFIAKKLDDYELYKKEVHDIFAAVGSEHVQQSEDGGEAEETKPDMQHDAVQDVSETL